MAAAHREALFGRTRRAPSEVDIADAEKFHGRPIIAQEQQPVRDNRTTLVLQNRTGLSVANTQLTDQLDRSTIDFRIACRLPGL